MIELAILFALLVASGVFSGSETGVYSLSPVRLRSDVKAGDRSARWVERLLGNKTGLLITLLIANNLVLELLAHRTDHLIDSWLDWPTWGIELFVTACLTPMVFFFGELFPKDLFRRRPHQALGLVAPLLVVVRAAFFVLAWPLEQFSRLATRVFDSGRTPIERPAREEVLEILQEGTRSGDLPPEVEGLALNALRLRTTPISAVMIRWADVATFDSESERSVGTAALAEARFSRLPALGEGGRVTGYVHQLDAFARPDEPPRMRKVPFLEPSTGLDRALAKLRISGQRLAVVGTPQKPLGLVTLANLVEAISSDLAEAMGRRRGLARRGRRMPDKNGNKAG